MSKFRCTCGNVISDVQCPNEVTGWLLSDKSGEQFFGAISQTIDDYLQHLAAGDIAGWRDKHFNEIYPDDISAGSMIHDVITSHFFDRTLAALECDNCGRLWLQEKPDINKYHAYSPDQSPEQRVKMLGHNEATSDSQANNRGITK